MEPYQGKKSMSGVSPVHEALAIECAKSIAKATLEIAPDALEQSIPVFVDVQGLDDNHCYRYQINISRSWFEAESQPKLHLQRSVNINGGGHLPPIKSTVLGCTMSNAIWPPPMPQADPLATVRAVTQANKNLSRKKGHFLMMSQVHVLQDEMIGYGNQLATSLGENTHVMPIAVSQVPKLQSLNYNQKVNQLNGINQSQTMNGFKGLQQLNTPNDINNDTNQIHTNPNVAISAPQALKCGSCKKLNSKYFADMLNELIMQGGTIDIPGYPQELSSLFRKDYCELCQTVLRTFRSARDHYASFNHNRHVSSWLVRQFCFEHNEHLAPAGPKAFYCDICDLQLTSITHAQQHFLGRRHREVANQERRSFGAGVYDQNGRWVRINHNMDLMCHLCNVPITSESQMDMHVAGARHRKRLNNINGHYNVGPINGRHLYSIKSNGVLVPLKDLGLMTTTTSTSTTTTTMCEVDNRLDAAFYCKACNITLNHLKSVKQHEEGRMHKRKLAFSKL